MEQVAQRWWEEDGDAAAFDAFCTENFIADPVALDEAFEVTVLSREEIFTGGYDQVSEVEGADTR